jgi:beta-ureidopropionase
MARPVTISFTSFALGGGRTAAQNREQACRYVDNAAVDHPDLVCLAENFLHSGLPDADVPVFEAIDGPTISALAERARRHRTYVCGSFCQVRPDGSRANTAFLLDRRGEVVGQYDKVHPTMDEITDRHVTPGATVPIIDTDFGRLGFAICYDIGWPEHWMTLARAGAELVVWPSAYDGGFPLQCYAWLHRYWLVTAVRTEHSKVIDPMGQVLASTSRWVHQLSRTIDLERQVLHVDGHQAKLARLLAERPGVRVELMAEEGVFALESDDPAWPVPCLLEEYGLETWAAYHRRAEAIQSAARIQAEGMDAGAIIAPTKGAPANV